MLSAGQWTSALKGKMDTLHKEGAKVRKDMEGFYDKRLKGSNKLDKTQARKAKAGDDYTETRDIHQDKKNDMDRAQADSRGDTQTAEAREQELKSAGRQKKQFENSIKDYQAKLKTDQMNANLARQTASIAKRMFVEDQEREFIKAQGQAIAKNKKDGLECIRVIHAHWMRDAGAHTGARSNASTNLDIGILAPVNAVKPTYQTYEQEAQAAAERAADTAAQLQDKENETFQDEQVAEAGRDFKEASDKRDVSKAKFDNAKVASDDAKRMKAAAKERYDNFEKKERAVKQTLSNYDNKIQKKKNEQARIGDEKSTTQLKAVKTK